MAKTKKTKAPSLKEYHRKRKFASTPEPKGDAKKDAKKRAKAKTLFFCVQKHLASHLHYDFRLEYKGVLLVVGDSQGAELESEGQAAGDAGGGSSVGLSRV